MTETEQRELTDRAVRLLEARGVHREGGELRFRCFFPDKHRNGDAHPSASFNVVRAVWCCRVCGAHGGVQTILWHLGQVGPAPARVAERTSATQANGRGVQREVARWILRDAAGLYVAEHVRLEPGRNGKSKDCLWYVHEAAGLGGRRVAELPLYGVDKLAHVPAGSTVVLVEGEKARDALAARGIAAVATVTGSGTIPTKDVLRVLVGYDVVGWPDADRPGREHMRQLGDRLTALKIPHRLVDPWPDRSDGSDAADWTDAPGVMHALLAPTENGGPQMLERGSVNWDDVRPWPALDEAALRGLAGDVVRLLDPTPKPMRPRCSSPSWFCSGML
jgi:hypothetical protein